MGVRERITTMGEVFTGAGNSCFAEDAMRQYKGDKITVEHLFCSAERGVNVGSKGLLLREGERKLSTIRVKNVLWLPEDLLRETGRTAARVALQDPCSLAAVSLRRAAWEFWCTPTCLECSCSLPPVATPNSLGKSCPSWLQVVDSRWG